MINSIYKPSIVRNNKFYKDQINIMGWQNVIVSKEKENSDKDSIDEMDQQV